MQVNYHLTRSDRRKRITIKIINNELYVLAPRRATKAQIELMLKNHESWIVNHLNNPKINLNFNLSVDKEVYLNGKKMRVIIFENCPSSIRIKDNMLYLSGRSINTIERDFVRYLSDIVFERVERIKKELKIDFICSTRFYKSRWGCCYKNRRTIILNYLLGCLSDDIIDEVIYHEIAHFTVTNHQKEFYAVLSRLCPNYKVQVKELKKYVIE